MFLCRSTAMKTAIMTSLNLNSILKNIYFFFYIRICYLAQIFCFLIFCQIQKFSFTRAQRLLFNHVLKNPLLWRRGIYSREGSNRQIRYFFLEKTYFTSFVRNVFWATILYKYHVHRWLHHQPWFSKLDGSCSGHLVSVWRKTGTLLSIEQSFESRSVQC